LYSQKAVQDFSGDKEIEFQYGVYILKVILSPGLVLFPQASKTCIKILSFCLFDHERKYACNP
jgi:hypothetical protein